MDFVFIAILCLRSSRILPGTALVSRAASSWCRRLWIVSLPLYPCSLPLLPPYTHLFLHCPWVFPWCHASLELLGSSDPHTSTFWAPGVQVLQVALVSLQVLAMVALVALNSPGIPANSVILLSEWRLATVSTCLFMSRKFHVFKTNHWHFYVFSRLSSVVSLHCFPVLPVGERKRSQHAILVR